MSEEELQNLMQQGYTRNDIGTELYDPQGKVVPYNSSYSDITGHKFTKAGLSDFSLTNGIPVGTLNADGTTEGHFINSKSTAQDALAAGDFNKYKELTGNVNMTADAFGKASAKYQATNKGPSGLDYANFGLGVAGLAYGVSAQKAAEDNAKKELALKRDDFNMRSADLGYEPAGLNKDASTRKSRTLASVSNAFV